MPRISGTVADLRPTLESTLALLVLALAVVWFPETVSHLPAGPLAEELLLISTFVVPTMLGILVLRNVFHDLLGMLRSLIASHSRPRPFNALAGRILVSAVFGLLAASTIWYATVSVYVIWFGNPGGVLLHPFVVLLFATPLGMLVLVRGVVRYGRTHRRVHGTDP